MYKVCLRGLFFVVMVILSGTVLSGCCHYNRAPDYTTYYNPLPEAERALAAAAAAGMDRECPDKFNAVKAKIEKAHSLNKAARINESLKMARQAICDARNLCPEERTPPLPPPATPAPLPPPVSEPETTQERVSIILTPIHFDYDRATLTPYAKEILKNNISMLQSNAGVRVQIEGHACAHGSEKYNMALSERRANAVKEYLVRSGISEDRLRTVAYGETRQAMPEIPTSENWNSPEAQANRRVQFEVILK